MRAKSEHGETSVYYNASATVCASWGGGRNTITESNRKDYRLKLRCALEYVTFKIEEVNLGPKSDACCGAQKETAGNTTDP